MLDTGYYRNRSCAFYYSSCITYFVYLVQLNYLWTNFSCCLWREETKQKRNETKQAETKRDTTETKQDKAETKRSETKKSSWRFTSMTSGCAKQFTICVYFSKLVICPVVVNKVTAWSSIQWKLTPWSDLRVAHETTHSTPLDIYLWS
jgi:hypothetical protein